MNNQDVISQNPDEDETQKSQPLLIKIDLGGDNYANIEAFKNSNSLDLAAKFC